eukprot:Lithocolla_globosa_v1_NODE_139_length_5801_cov_6.461364.p3 type:complete len:199 gc:universal NODE_139_length_5801_cov_6.461364:5720-5124(-)
MRQSPKRCWKNQKITSIRFFLKYIICFLSFLYTYFFLVLFFVILFMNVCFSHNHVHRLLCVLLRGPFSPAGRLFTEEKDVIGGEEYDISEKSIARDFPKHSEKYIAEKITLGTYQLKQARHYTDEHVDKKGGFSYYVHRQADDLIRVRLQSRHSNSTKYFAYVTFEPRKDGKKGEEDEGKVTGCIANVKPATEQLVVV